MRTADHLKAIDDRLNRLDAKIEARFAAVDARFGQVDKRFGEVDKRFGEVDKRFDEQRAHTNALFEASRADFNNLYDFVKAQAEKTDLRFDQMQTDFRTRFIDLQTAITALPRGRRTSGRRRR
jgi:tetrahydromethanopterin S-methyltransferase subunit G